MMLVGLLLSYPAWCEMIEEKLGKVLGLEMAAQKAVEQFISNGL
jgi:hypothetical protein